MLSDVLDIEHEEQQRDARKAAFAAEDQAAADRIQAKRAALAARMAESGIPAVMKQPGDSTVALSIDGQLHVVSVTYLQPAPEPAPAAAPDPTPASA